MLLGTASHRSLCVAAIATSLLDWATLFSTVDMDIKMPGGDVVEKKMVTTKLVFESKMLDLLRSQVGVSSTSQVEAMASLPWKNSLAVRRQQEVSVF